MYYTQAFALLPLFLLTPLTLAAPSPAAAAEPQAPPPVCTLGRTPFNCPFPDRQSVDPTFLGFTGNFKGIGFPYYLNSPTQGFVCPGRVDDTVRRALQIPRVAQNYNEFINGPKRGDPRSVSRCLNSPFPIFQGTTYIGNQQIFITYDQNAFPDPTGHDVTYCGLSSPAFDTTEYFVTDCTIPIPP